MHSCLHHFTACAQTRGEYWFWLFNYATNIGDIGYLEGESFFTLRLPEDHNDTQDTQQDQNDTRRHPHDLQIHDGLQTLSQNHAQQRDQQSYTQHKMLELEITARSISQSQHPSWSTTFMQKQVSKKNLLFDSVV